MKIQNLTFALVLTLSIFALGGCDVVAPEMDSLDARDTEKLQDGLQLQPTMGPLTVYSGLRHYAMGDATLVGELTELLINGIGSSGLDGVCIDLGAAESHGLVMDPVSPLNTGLDWMARGFVDGSDFLLWQQLKLRDGEIVLRLDGSQSAATNLTIDVWEHASRIHHEFVSSTVAEMTLDSNAALTGTSVSAAVASAVVSKAGGSAGASGMTMIMKFAEPVSMVCPEGGTMQTDEIHATWNVPSPRRNLDWTQELLFTREAGANPTDVVIHQSAITQKGLTYARCEGALVLAQRAGGAIGFQGDLARVSIDGFFDQDRALSLKGVALKDVGQSWQLEIEGVTQGAKMPGPQPQQLIINLSLGWHPQGLQATGDFPSGTGYRMTVVLNGQVVQQVTRPNGQSSWALPNASFAGFELQSFDFDPQSYTYDAIGRFITPDGPVSSRLRFESIGVAPNSVIPNEVSVEYNRLAGGTWYTDLRDRKDKPNQPDLMER